MVGPLLETKFHLPRRRRSGVARTRLDDRLAAGLGVALTLVSAPPGFGKTTLLAEWSASPAAAGHTVAWLSLDAGDNEPAVFWTCLITALRTAVGDAAPGLGAAASALLQSPRSPIDAVLAGLLNEVDAVAGEIVVVLDDYHLIDDRAVHDGIAFLLEHLPPRLHLVIATRADPAIPLARLRGRGELLEIRAADLRFTPGEAATYLTGHMGLALTDDAVAALEARTEGWIAALQLVAVSLAGRDDPTAFIAGFAGDDRYVVDYLAEEVLDRQPDDIARFLLETSILDRVCGPLCDAVTGRHDSSAMLATVERRNLFLVPLDDRRRWYRYHQLFADMLRTRLQALEPDTVAALHRRAAGWYDRAGDPSAAIHHALAGGDFDHAADLAEAAIPEMGRTRRESAVLGWSAALPHEVVRNRPVLLLGFVGALLLVGRFEGVEARLRDIERLLTARPADPPEPLMYVDEARFRGLPGMIELYRAAVALGAGDVPGTVRHSGRARERAAPDDALCRSAAAGLSGLACWSDGDLDAGYAAYTDCLAGLYEAGYVADTFGCAVALADIRITQGGLGAALGVYERTLQRAAGPTGPPLRGTADMYVGMSRIALERGDPALATALLQRSAELGDDAGLPQTPYRRRVAMAGVRRAEGDLAGAVALLGEAEQLYNGDLFPDGRPIAAIRAGVWIAQGAVQQAQAWADGRGLSDDDPPGYLREFEHLVLARLLTAGDEDARRRAVGLLGRLLTAAEAGGRTGSVIEILVLQAVAHRRLGDVAAAVAGLGRAVALASAEGYVQVFVNEGPVLTPLLGALAKRGTQAGHARRLLGVAPPVSAAPHGLVAPLTDREREVLRLLGTDLDGPGIARLLVVSLHTVRTHTQHIYDKLGVTDRRAAVTRARELHLLSAPERTTPPRPGGGVGAS